MSSLATEASLIIATMDLSVVQMLRQAIRTADISSAAGVAGREVVAVERANLYCRRHICLDPIYEPRCHICPPPIYQARPIIHTHPRVEQAMLHCADCAPPAAGPSKIPSENPIEPPWKVLPWENPAPPRQTVKIHLCHTDVVNKGTLLDLFV